MQTKLDGESRLFPILGDPIRYARSPELLTASLAERGQNALCIPMQVPDSSLDAVMGGLSRVANVDGLLITMPHKNAVFAHCATASETSRLLKTVSVMRRNPDGSWDGHSQDGDAFVKAQIDAGATPAGATVLLVGAGGAGSAIAISLLSAGVAELRIHDIDRSRVDRLVELLSGLANGRAKPGEADPSGCDMVCNATNLGMAAGDPLPVPAQLLTSSMFVGDVIAGHGVTPFLAAARAAGCATASGDQMVEAVQGMMVDYLLAGARLP